MNAYTKEIWIGDYSILIWVPKGANEKEIIKEYFATTLSAFGLKIVDA